MTPPMIVLLLGLAVLLYVYRGYPLLLRVVVWIRGGRQVRQAPITPSLSLVISAFNEADVIRRKLENALALDYPRDDFEIVVISDASDDGTDAIVAEYRDRHVRLIRQEQRRGKTAGLNRAVPMLRGEIVVFSDANALYQADALVKLTRSFADTQVGCVTGEARYLVGNRSAADLGERAYWDYEIQLKKLETALGSMVGGDGAIYAIRRALWRTLPDNAINDFLNPLQIVAAGWRAVYEPEAVCYEETAGGVRTEYRRRVRIVSRSWRAVFQARGVLNPVRVGFFTWSLVSHKMLRWLSGLFAAAVAIGATVMLGQALTHHPLVTSTVVGLTAVLLMATPMGRRALGITAYAATISAASVVGVIKGSFGQVSGVWATPRQAEDAAPRPVGALVPVGLVIQLSGLLVIAGAIGLYRSVPTPTFAAVVFWASTTMLAYIYVGYLLVLAVTARLTRNAVRREAIEPRVCVLIAANDEASVLAAKLQNTLALDYPADRLDVVVASDGSLDGTNDIARQFAPRVRLLAFAPRRGKIATINQSMAVVDADVVVFSDANTFLEPDALRALVRNFADPQVGAVSGDVVLIGERAALGHSEDLYYRYERWVQHAESALGSMIGADGALYAIRRALFVAPPADTILDDMAIPMGVIKSGYRVVFDAAARASEQGSDTAQQEFSRKVRVIAGAMQFLGRRDSSVPLAVPQVIFSLISHKVLRWLSPAFVAATFVSSALLSDAAPVYATAMAAQTGVLVLALAGCVPQVRRIGPVSIAHYFCLVQAAAAVGFFRGLAGRQSVLWQRFARIDGAGANGVRL